MTSLRESLNQQIAGDEATLSLTKGESFLIRGDIESLSDLFISIYLSNNPDKEGCKLVNVNHIVSIER